MEPVRPSTHCDFPVGLAERLPADGVALSVRLAAPSSYSEPFPSSASDLWPTARGARAELEAILGSSLIDGRSPWR